MKYLPYGAAVVFAVLLAFVVRQAFPIVVTVPGVPIIKTDTFRVEHFNLDTIIVYRDRVITDTVTLTHEVIISDPVMVPCPDLPRIRGITRLTAGQGFDDTTMVALVDVWAQDGQIAIQDQVQKLYTPGPLLYIEASDPVRYDFGTWPVTKECGFWCKAQWFGLGLAGGVVAWEIAR